MRLNRRTFVGTGLATAASLHAPMLYAAANGGRPRVVVVGGGAGGATVARHLARDAGGALDITLIEPNTSYTTCFFSNHYLGGFRSLESLTHSYDALARLGVALVHDRAAGIDRAARTVALAGGGALPYDRLVLSPGIDFVPDAVPGWDVSRADRMPHAYTSGTQAEALRAQIEAMPPGGTFALIAPADPFRCPVAPYERVSMVAHKLTLENPTARILIVDAKQSFSMAGLFEEGWETYYPGMIERLGPDFGGDLVTVNPDEMTVDIDGIVEQVDVCNVIPAQQAGRIVIDTGLADGRWAPVDPASMRSTIDANVTILGDSARADEMPKSAFAANSQGRVAALAIRGELTGAAVEPAAYGNACWSAIAPDDAVKVGATYAAGDGSIARVDGFISQPHEDPGLRKQTWDEGEAWYDEVTADMFG